MGGDKKGVCRRKWQRLECNHLRAVTLVAARTTRTPAAPSSSFFCRVQLSPTTQPVRQRPKASTLPACSTSDTPTTTRHTRPIPLPSPPSSPLPPLPPTPTQQSSPSSRTPRALLQHRPRRHLHVTAPPNPIREVSYVCSSHAATFTLLARTARPSRSEMSSLAGRGRGKIRPPRRVSHRRQPDSPRVISTHYTCYTTTSRRAYQRNHVYCKQC